MCRSVKRETHPLKLLDGSRATRRQCTRTMQEGRHRKHPWGHIGCQAGQHRAAIQRHRPVPLVKQASRDIETGYIDHWLARLYLNDQRWMNISLAVRQNEFVSNDKCLTTYHVFGSPFHCSQRDKPRRRRKNIIHNMMKKIYSPIYLLSYFALLFRKIIFRNSKNFFSYRDIRDRTCVVNYRLLTISIALIYLRLVE